MLSRAVRWAVFPAVLVVPFIVGAQREVASSKRTTPSSDTPVASPTVAVAVRATKAPVIDGEADDAIWSAAQVFSDFRTFDPVENGDPRFRTEARVAYDDHNLYILVRAFDPHPDSIVALLSRRDARTQSEWLKVIIDGDHDRRTGIELSVNPAGVKRDFAILNDGEEAGSWDGVWDVGTHIDSLGWVAEFRVPLNQLRYPAAPTHTFGFGIWRDVARFNERYSWPVYSRSKNGLSSQLGDLAGIDGIDAVTQREVAPGNLTIEPRANSFVGPRLPGAFFLDAGLVSIRLGARIRFSGTWHLVSGTWHRYLAPGTWHLAPDRITLSP